MKDIKLLKAMDTYFVIQAIKTRNLPRRNDGKVNISLKIKINISEKFV